MLHCKFITQVPQQRLKSPVMALEPSLWGTLPNELLDLVFARLHVAGIGQLRVLSKEWKRNVDCKDSEFNQVIDATSHLNIFGFLYWKYYDLKWKFGFIYDVGADKCHVYKTDAVLQNVVGDDGGLVCCVSKWRWQEKKPGFFTVVNPLTKQKTQLPPLLCMGVEKSSTLVIALKMVKLTMDRKAKEYKVFVVGSIENGGRGVFAQVYDSHIKEWMVVEATQGHIIGWDCKSYWSDGFCHNLCVYNCTDGTLQQINVTDIPLGLEVERGCFVLIEDHLFVLYKEASPGCANILGDGENMLPKYCITEFNFSEQTSSWMKLGVHSRIPRKCLCFMTFNICTMRLWGCKGFLLVYDDGSDRASLYNLSTCEWCNLPNFRRPSTYQTMCTINWSAVA